MAFIFLPMQTLPGGVPHKLKRRPKRQRTSNEFLHEVLDEAWLAYLATAAADHTHLLPMAHVRVDAEVFVHGAQKNGFLRAALAGEPVTLCCTLLDGLVLDHSGLHHSMNYRSVVV